MTFLQLFSSSNLPGKRSDENINMKSMKVVKIVTMAAFAMVFSLSALGQVSSEDRRPDEVDQLAQMVGLSEEQQVEIRSLVAEMSPKIERLQVEAQELQEKLYEMAGPDFVESEIRQEAAKLGQLSGEIVALSIILQSRVDQIFTSEQRAQLEALQEQQMQQQMMQQQMMQQQMQQQMMQQQLQEEK